jgi:hypothetical protein
MTTDERLFPDCIGEVLHALLNPEPQPGSPYTHTFTWPETEYDDDGEPLPPKIEPSMTVNRIACAEPPAPYLSREWRERVWAEALSDPSVTLFPCPMPTCRSCRVSPGCRFGRSRIWCCVPTSSIRTGACIWAGRPGRVRAARAGWSRWWRRCTGICCGLIRRAATVGTAKPRPKPGLERRGGQSASTRSAAPSASFWV